MALALRYKLLALDLDGTVLDLHLRLDPRDLDEVARIVRAGVMVVACTGRPFPGAVPWVRRLGLDGPIVCYQGAEVRTLDGAVLLDHGVGHDLAMEVVRYARERDRPEAHVYARHAGMDVHLVSDLDAAIGPTTPKLVIVSTTEVVEPVLADARRRWAGRLNVATSVPEYLEFTSLESDKGSALRFLCERYGVPQTEAAAVGDGRNDASMLAWAGLGVAVEGAPPEVIAAADRTIAGPGHGGMKQLADALLA